MPNSINTIISEGLYCGDCLELMSYIESGSIDMILCDLPYGTTANKWDIVISLDAIWNQYSRIIKSNGAIVLSGAGLFSVDLINSNRKMYKYTLIWEKTKSAGFLNANKMPLRTHEDILIFYNKIPTYNPQKIAGTPYSKVHSYSPNYSCSMRTPTINTDGERNPGSIIKIINDQNTVHPTQKPVRLMEWLIRTYTNEGDIVLDNCMGSGSTGVACKYQNRRFIGIEQNEEYFNAAKDRIDMPKIKTKDSFYNPKQIPLW